MMGRALLTVGALATLGLIASAGLGYTLQGPAGEEMSRHVLAALASTLLLLFSHCWILFYLAGTGRAVRQTVAEHGLDAALAGETRRFRARTYAWLGLAMALVMAMFVLGGGAVTEAFPAWVHHALFWPALAVQAWTLRIEKLALDANERLMADIDRRLA